MKKQYPSDELVNVIFNLFIEEGYPDYYNFPEFANFIDLAINFRNIPDSYDKNGKCRLFSKISKEQREYVLTKNEEYVKSIIKAHTIDEKIFNLNYFRHTFDDFISNKKISKVEKKALIGLHSIRTMTPINLSMKSIIKELSKDEILDWLDLSPIEDIYLYANKWKNNKYLTSILKEYNEEIFDLAKSCESYDDFAGMLFINYDYVAAYFDFPVGKTEALTGGIRFYDKLQESEFYYEYNIPGENRDFYKKVKELRYGTDKEKELYRAINEKFSRLNTWHDLENMYEQIKDGLQEAYPIEKILEILKKVSENAKISKEEKQMYSEFFKGIDYIYRYHNSHTFIRLQEPYFYAIAATEEFNNSFSYASYPNIVNYLRRVNTKIRQKDIEEIIE